MTHLIGADTRCTTAWWVPINFINKIDKKSTTFSTTVSHKLFFRTAVISVFFCAEKPIKDER